MSEHLTEGELDQLLSDAQAVDRGMHPKLKIFPRLRRVLAELKEIRDQQGVREFIEGQEVIW